MTDTNADPIPADLAHPAVEGMTQPPMIQPQEKEIGGPKESAPTRYGDWTVKGRCIDF